MSINQLIKNPLFQIHLSVFLWGFTAILGKLISLDAILLVFLRMSLAGVIFFCLPMTRQSLRFLTKPQYIQLAIIGTFICIHWLCFYYSIKVFNSSSIALVCLGTGPMFVIWIQSIFSKSFHWQKKDLLISLIAIIGMVFISFGNKNNHLNNWNINYLLAIFFGLMASLLAAVFTLLNKHYTSTIHPLTTSFVELSTGALWLGIWLIFSNKLVFILSISTLDWLYIALLSTLCTVLPFSLSILALKKLKAFTVTLSVNLEPIYGMIFAGLIFKEFSSYNVWFFLGSFLILSSVFILPIIQIKQSIE